MCEMSNTVDQSCKYVVDPFKFSWIFFSAVGGSCNCCFRWFSFDWGCVISTSHLPLLHSHTQVQHVQTLTHFSNTYRTTVQYVMYTHMHGNTARIHLCKYAAPKDIKNENPLILFYPHTNTKYLWDCTHMHMHILYTHLHVHTSLINHYQKSVSLQS